MKTKICTKCGIEKTLSDFYKFVDCKDGYRNDCKECVKKRNSKNCTLTKRKKNLNRRKKHQQEPWHLIYSNLKRRCNNPNNFHYKYYGEKGIKCKITKDEIKELYIRDKAHLMKRPSIDRINSNGHYEYSNCRFIELGENSCRNKRKPIFQFDLQGNFIREFKSISDAFRQTNINNVSISHACNNIYKTAGGFIWKWKIN